MPSTHVVRDSTKLHAERPIAAADRIASDGDRPAGSVRPAATAIQDYVKYIETQKLVGDYILSRIVGDYIASVIAAEAEAAAPRRASRSVYSNSDPGASSPVSASARAAVTTGSTTRAGPARLVRTSSCPAPGIRSPRRPAVGPRRAWTRRRPHLADQDAMASGALRAAGLRSVGRRAADVTDLARAAAAVRGSRRGPA